MKNKDECRRRVAASILYHGSNQNGFLFYKYVDHNTTKYVSYGPNEKGQVCLYDAQDRAGSHDIETELAKCQLTR